MVVLLAVLVFKLKKIITINKCMILINQLAYYFIFDMMHTMSIKFTCYARASSVLFHKSYHGASSMVREDIMYTNVRFRETQFWST